jgi:hypothetical protein
MPQILPSLLKQAHAIQVELVRHTTDPVVHRRGKFVAALKDQLTLLDNAKSSKSARRRRKQPDGTYAQTDVQIKIKPMWREDAKGNVILQPHVIVHVRSLSLRRHLRRGPGPSGSRIAQNDVERLILNGSKRYLFRTPAVCVDEEGRKLLPLAP